MQESLNSKQNNYGQGKESIIKAAAHLFVERGFKQTTLRDLGRLSGVNTALISYYFGDKNGLLKAVLEEKLESFHKNFQIVESEGKNLSMNTFLSFIDSALIDFQVDPSILLLPHGNLRDKGMPAQFAVESCNTAESKIAGAVQILNPKLSELEALCRVQIIGASLQKYCELLWASSQNEAKKQADSLAKIFRKNILKMIPGIINQ